MKPRKLSPEELKETNGGSNDGMSSSAGIGIGTDSLLSLNYQWSQGDKNYKSSTEVGKDVHVDFNALNLNKE